ncbi:MAG: ATP-dependent Clp protease ATP-binding subunit ClpX, partial [Phycicoccus sp.]
RAIMEEVLLPVMFDVPSDDEIAKVQLTRDVVLKNVNPTIVRTDTEAPGRKRTPRKRSA